MQSLQTTLAELRLDSEIIANCRIFQTKNNSGILTSAPLNYDTVGTIRMFTRIHVRKLMICAVYKLGTEHTSSRDGPKNSRTRVKIDSFE